LRASFCSAVSLSELSGHNPDNWDSMGGVGVSRPILSSHEQRPVCSAQASLALRGISRGTRRRRVAVSEDSLRQDARILAYKFDPAVRQRLPAGGERGVLLSKCPRLTLFSSHPASLPPRLRCGCMTSPGGATTLARERAATPPRVPPRLAGRAVRLSRRAGRSPRVRPSTCVCRPRVPTRLWGP